MKTIAITLPSFIADEGKLINRLFEEGYWRVHIRKPDATAAQHRRLIEQIDPRWHQSLSLHDHHEVALEYGCGIHLNARHPEPPSCCSATLSASCHSFAEVVKMKRVCQYVFLSPIFDSISKQGYRSAFSEEEIRDAAKSGIIDERVIALGGISFSKLQLVSDYGFGGAAMLGEVWR